MADYGRSTQRREWTWTAESCRELRTAARQQVLDYSSTSDLLSEQETADLSKYYEQSISLLCLALRLPIKAMATSIALFRRFHLTKSVLLYNPTVSALTAVYASSKIEEHLRSTEDVIQAAKHPQSTLSTDSIFQLEGVTSQVVLGYEAQFLQALKFHLVCFHPYRSLEAALRVLSADDKPIAAAAKKVIDRRVLFSDLALTISPGMLAVAALLTAARESQESDEAILKLIPSLAEKEVSQPTSEKVSTAVDTVESACKELMAVKTRKVPSLDGLRMLESRRRMTVDPAKDPCSKEFIDAEQQTADRKEAVRKRKAQEDSDRLRKQRADLLGVAFEPNKRVKPDNSE